MCRLINYSYSKKKLGKIFNKKKYEDLRVTIFKFLPIALLCWVGKEDFYLHLKAARELIIDKIPEKFEYELDCLNM